MATEPITQTGTNPKKMGNRSINIYPEVKIPHARLIITLANTLEGLEPKKKKRVTSTSYEYSEYEERLNKLITNFDFETDSMSSPVDFLSRIAKMFDSETAFIVFPNGNGKLNINYIYTEIDSLQHLKTIDMISIFSKVINNDTAITVNDEEDIDEVLRKLGVRSMIAVPLPNKLGLLVVCNRKNLLKFNVAYVSYDVKICYAITFLLFRGSQLFLDPVAKRLDDLQTEINEIKSAIQEITATYVNSVTVQEQIQGIVINDFVRERDAYLRMERELLQKYPEQFVGIYQGELIAVNSDKMELMREIREKKGNVRAFIRKITAEQPVIKLSGSRNITK